jgi:hypothetical protein
MFKRKLWILVLVLLGLALVPTAFATQPAQIGGYFDQFVPGDADTPTVYCLHTGENYTSDGFIDGCVVQPVKPGLAQIGTFTGTVDGKDGTCIYSLRTFDLDGIARFSMHRCSGDLAGFHMVGVGWAINGLWEGSYHFEP